MVIEFPYTPQEVVPIRKVLVFMAMVLGLVSISSPAGASSHNGIDNVWWHAYADGVSAVVPAIALMGVFRLVDLRKHHDRASLWLLFTGHAISFGLAIVFWSSPVAHLIFATLALATGIAVFFRGDTMLRRSTRPAT